MNLRSDSPPPAGRGQGTTFLLAMIVGLPLMAPAAEPDVTTHTFKVIGSPPVRLGAEVYRLPGEEIRPVVLFIHGGALMMGGRSLSAQPGSLLDALLADGYVVVSIDYRLAPQVKLPAIIEDVRDACAWVRERGLELFRIDPGRLFVMGQSAGGYLTLMTGFCIQPPPKALVSFWGYGDIMGPWYSEPDPFYHQQPLVTKEEAEKSGGSKLYLYCRQQGLWPKVVTGHDPAADPRAFDPFCPDRNVTREYPPTLLIHGTKDTDVPYNLSVRMDQALTAKSVAHKFITIPGGGHGFSRNDQEIASRTYRQMLEFLKQHQARAMAPFAVPSNMVWCPPGVFTMGSPGAEPERSPDETQHEVKLTRGFCIGKYEVTQREYEAVIGSNPSGFKGDLNRPVERVSWSDATNYCRKLTQNEGAAGRVPTGYEYRLPTEAEWEYACRAGTQTMFSYGDDPSYSQLGDHAWFLGSTTHPVGQKRPNA